MTPQPDGKLGYRFITGYENPCIPKECCTADGNALNLFIFTMKTFRYKTILLISGATFNRTAFPCLYSPPGVHADIFIYKLGKTYVSTVPMFNNGIMNSKIFKYANVY